MQKQYGVCGFAAGQQEILVQDFTGELVLAGFKTVIQKRVETDWSLEWIMPNFTTTTETDVMTANVLTMGLMQAYFTYSGCQLLKKLDHSVDFGEESDSYSKQLRHIVSRFVKSFDAPDHPETRAFWNNIVHVGIIQVCGLPLYYLTGWLAGFFFWDANSTRVTRTQSNYTLDGVGYGRRGIDDLPVGYAQAPFTTLDYPDQQTPRFEVYVLAGNVSKQITQGLPDGYAEALKRFNDWTVNTALPHGILRPMAGWKIYGPGSHNTTVHRTDMDPESYYLKVALDRAQVPQCKA